jgi:ADP-ribosylarginine hydrolase
LGGVEKLFISSTKWKLSDDTVMHIATGEALVEASESLEKLYPVLAKKYVECFNNDMVGRAPGKIFPAKIFLLKFSGHTTALGIAQIKKGGWNAVKYGKSGGGCGGSMRSMCIGLRYYGENNRDDLIAASIESGRMSHNHPTGFLGAMVSSLFTAFAIENVPVVSWGRKLVVEILPRAYAYLEVTEKRFLGWLIFCVENGERLGCLPKRFEIFRKCFYRIFKGNTPRYHN